MVNFFLKYKFQGEDYSDDQFKWPVIIVKHIIWSSQYVINERIAKSIDTSFFLIFFF